MFDRHAGGERVVVVQLDLGSGEFDERLEEIRLLVESAGAEVCGLVTGRRQSPDPATFAGKGKVLEIAAEVSENQAELVVFNHALSPAQERNLS